MKKLDWSDLYYFAAVARHGSLAKAAQALGVTHSTVFRRITGLEEDLSAKLFDRLPEGYRLTALGRELESYSERIAGTIDEMQRIFENRNEELKGPINLTAPHNFAYRFLPPLIAEFRTLYPDITVNMLASNADYNLSRREADLAIRATPAPPDYLAGQKLFSLGWSAYASPGYQQLNPPLTQDDPFRDQQVILASNELSHIAVFQWAEKHLDARQIVSRCNDLMSMSALAVAGVGIALLPDDQAKPELQSLFALDSRFRSDIWVLMHPDLRGCARLMLFKDFIVTRLREEPLFQGLGALIPPPSPATT
ncbi:MAG: LysR family transcriptional regulator [Gammaproteobacteria bacterium]|nr:LysR family transcriptional regulator [Gammaproteobacteria bacterium]